MLALDKNVCLPFFFFPLVSTITSADSCQISDRQPATCCFLLLANLHIQYWKYREEIIYVDPGHRVHLEFTPPKLLAHN